MRNKTSRVQRSGKVRVGMLLLISVVVLVASIFLIGIYGQVSGEEFSAQKLTIRRFSYVQIPLLRIQVWPVRLVKVGGEDDKLADYIRRNTRKNNVISKIRAATVRWDIVTMQEAGTKGYRGDASILTNYLRQPPRVIGLESWLDWTKANPKLADELWAVVIELAHADLYVVAPDVLEAARNLDASNFGVQLRKIAASECRKIAKAHDEEGDKQRAASVSAFAKRIETEKVVISSAKPRIATSAEANPESEDLEAEIDKANAK